MTLQSEFDINVLLHDAQNRWLKPAEVLFILQNNEKHGITQETPQNPPSGSLFLFNRRVLRFFRKDGHSWRKKRDGRTVGEAHERLKVGNVDALNCYYAHGEQNPNFQRRSYWMLDPAYDHIVLVHYREVIEGRHNVGSISNLSTDSSSSFIQNSRLYNAQNPGGSSGISELYEQHMSSFSPGSLEEVSSNLVVKNTDMDNLDLTERSSDFGSSSGQEVNQALKRLEVQLSLDDDDDNSIYFAEKLPPYYSQNEKSKYSELLPCEKEESTHDPSVVVLPEFGYKKLEQYLDGNAGIPDYSNNIQFLQNSGDKWKQHGQPQGAEYPVEKKGSSSWKDVLGSAEIDSRNKNSDTFNHLQQSQPRGAEYPIEKKGSLSWIDVLDSAEIDSRNKNSDTFRLKAGFLGKDMTLHNGILSSSDMPKFSANQAGHGENLASQWLDYRENDDLNSESNLSLQLSAARQFLLGAENVVSPTSNQVLQEVDKSSHSTYSSGTSTYEANSGVATLRKTNSFGWMETRQVPVDNHKYSSDYFGMWFPQESHLGTPLIDDSSLTIAQIQRFSIREISPEWAYSTEVTKVIITGDFLCDPSECAWSCMFGDVEVPLEIIQVGVLRCQAPPHVAGKVTLCITSGNRESCSEIREFEYRSMPNSTALDSNISHTDATKTTEELVLLVRFTEILLLGFDSVSVPKEDNFESGIQFLRKLKVADDQWGQIIKALLLGSETPSNITDWIVQELLKDKLQQWLASKHREGEVSGFSLSKQEQGIIHLVAGLGYEWALNSILKCGIGVNFRDVNGWTALHWAALFGREKMVAALLAADASAGAVTDPTSRDTTGKTPASIAAASGHKGLAGYLSEVALTSHLLSLRFEQNEISKGSAAVEAERTVESISDRRGDIPVDTIEDQISLKESLAAVRNAAQAAAQIQSAFRAHSFRRRQQRDSESCDEYGMTPTDIRELSAASKFQRDSRSLHDHNLNKAALSIQKNYRGWKRRKEFLTLRRHVVKIQAHVRGHQVRKNYKFVWMVGILEKVVLRWRRKGVGFRGFRTETESIDESDGDDDILRVFRKQKVDAAIDEAVARVLSMVESPKARHQYRRMLESCQQAKAELSNIPSEATSSSQSDGYNMVNYDDMYNFSLDFNNLQTELSDIPSDTLSSSQGHGYNMVNDDDMYHFS
ncbi:calmodulin-binding transcription activator 4-like isoform X2 [Tasmannia lanceolata]|uniref:calmodulin-binding transcription activator 4-like isoform X2 n=1 Tax=Tasmannia lanceolata TaxID=3420 RepID=UPI00406355AC